MYLPQGTELQSRYVIESLLGHGGFGITYSAFDRILKVRVAIKEYLPRQLATRAEGQTKVSVYSGDAIQHYQYGLRKFMEEAQAVARFSHHPNIVSARDYFEANGTAYMVMEYVEGVTLKEYLNKKGGRISFEEAQGIMMPVMDALREVHQVGLLHRDVSPDNVYITTSAQVKILDFGAARYQAGEQSKSLSVILKPGYAPEEQYRSSGKQGPWTDIYAVGATIYKALTGKTPPDALDRKEEDTLEPPSQLGVAIPLSAEEALLKALAVTASQRFQSMGEFQQALMDGEPMTVQFQAGMVQDQS
ncbi:MAG: serine/threonine protein kinase, partial [Deltaproteobacteria bacterium]